MRAILALMVMNAPSFIILYPRLIVPALIILGGIILISAIITKMGAHDARHRYTRR